MGEGAHRGWSRAQAIMAGRVWVLKCLAVNALGSAVDYTVLLLSVNVLQLATPSAAMLGVGSGAVFNFLVNRRFTFGEVRGPLGSQAFRFALVTGALMVVHALFVGFLRDDLGVPLIPAKMAGDLCILAFPFPFLLRRFVFSLQARPLRAETIIRVAGERLSV